MSEYWNAVGCGAVFGVVLGFGIGVAWATWVWTNARRKADRMWDK